MKYPTGFSRPDGSKQIAVRFPDHLFSDIISMAKKEKKEFNEMVVELVKCGKLCLDESNALEPKH